jgi:hypothetical protein
VSGADDIHDEAAAAAGRLRQAPDDWRAWWEERGERELRCILMTAWDPIGVGSDAGAWDEYDSYLGGVARCLLDGAADDDEGAARVDEYLRHVVLDFIGLSAVRASVGLEVVAWHECSYWEGGRPPTEWIDDVAT